MRTQLHNTTLLLITLFIFSLQSLHADLKDHLEPANLSERIKEEIAGLEIGFSADLLELDALEGLGLGIQYKYKVQPSYMESYYSRVDRWVFNTDLRPGDFVKDLDLPISLNFDTGAEILFVRQFPSQRDALKAAPYTPKRIPFRARWAKKNLVPGDFVSIPTHLNIVVRAGASHQEGVLSAEASTHYLLSGQFMIHLFRLPEDRIRMKLIALRRRGPGAGANLKLDFEIFGIRIIDRQIRKLFELDLAGFDSSRESGDLFLLDYVLDLKDEEASKAYNQVMNSNLKFKDLAILNPFQSEKALESRLISDLTLIEELREQDLESENKRVERLFRGQNSYERQSRKTRIGLIVARFDRERVFSQNRIVHFNDNNEPKHFGFSTTSFYRKRKLFWGLGRKSQVYSISSLIPTNEEGQETGFSDLVISSDTREKTLYGFELREEKESMIRNFSPAIFNQIDFGDFSENKKSKNARVFSQIFFHQPAIDHFRTLSRDFLEQMLSTYIGQVPLSMPSNQVDQGETEREAFEDLYARSMRKMIDGIMKAISPEEGQDPYKHFKEQLFELRENRAWKKLGTGFLISLLPQESLSEYVYVNLRLDAKDKEGLRFHYGDHPKSELYKEIEFVQSVLNKRSFDLRLEENTGQEFQAHDFRAAPEPDLEEDQGTQLDESIGAELEGR